MARSILQTYRALRFKLEEVRFELKASQDYLDLLLKTRKIERLKLHDAHNTHHRNPTKRNYDHIESMSFNVQATNRKIKDMMANILYYKEKVKEVKSKLSCLLINKR